MRRILHIMPDDAPREWDVAADAADAAYLMSNLFPEDTGLPMVVWINYGGGDRHDVRVKVSPVHGARIVLDDMAVVGVRPEPRLLHGALSRADLDVVIGWIALNRDVIIDHWNGEASSIQVAQRLRRLPG